MPHHTSSGLKRTPRCSFSLTTLLSNKPTTEWTMTSTSLSETGTNHKFCLDNTHIAKLSPSQPANLQLSYAEIALSSELRGTYTLHPPTQDSSLDLFLNCSWLVHDLFMIRSRLVNDLFLTCSWLVHYVFMTCSWLVYDLLKTFS